MSGLCPDCRALPCDCDKPHTWGYYFRNKAGRVDFYCLRSRKAAMEAWKQTERPDAVCGTTRGPVQRNTDPAHRFDEPTDQYEIRVHSFQRICDPPPAMKCTNIWCKDVAPPGQSFCSDRCHDYDTKRAAIYHRLESYKTKLARHQDKGMTRAAEVALASEVAWAEQQTKSEVDALERQWRALTWRT